MTGDVTLAIPTEQVLTAADLFEWYSLQEQLKVIKAKEMTLRLKIFKVLVPNPNEGTNTVKLDELDIMKATPTGFVLKATHTIDRKLDLAAATVLAKQFAEEKINAELLIVPKYELSISQYRTLTKEQMHLFDQCLVIKPGSPSLEIKKPAR